MLQQHFPGAQLQQSASYPSMQLIQHQQHPQPQRFISHQQIVQSQHQQMTSTVSIGQSQPVPVFVTAGNQQQQQQYHGQGMQHSQLRQYHHQQQPNFASPTHPSIHAQQHQGMPTLTANGGQQTHAEYGTLGQNTPEAGRISIKQEQQEPSPVALEQSVSFLSIFLQMSFLYSWNHQIRQVWRVRIKRTHPPKIKNQ